MPTLRTNTLWYGGATDSGLGAATTAVPPMPLGVACSPWPAAAGVASGGRCAATTGAGVAEAGAAGALAGALDWLGGFLEQESWDKPASRQIRTNLGASERQKVFLGQGLMD